MDYPIRFEWEDIDYAHVIFWMRYFSFVERAISDWMLQKGMRWEELLGRRNVGMPAISVAADFYKPMHLQEEATLELGVCEVSPQGCCFVFNIWLQPRSAGLAASGYVRRCFVDHSRFAAGELPAELLQIFHEMAAETRHVTCRLRSRGAPVAKPV